MSRPINSCGVADCHICWGYSRDTLCPMIKEALTEHETRLLDRRQLASSRKDKRLAVTVPSDE